MSKEKKQKDMTYALIECTEVQSEGIQRLLGNLVDTRIDKRSDPRRLWIATSNVHVSIILCALREAWYEAYQQSKVETMDVIVTTRDERTKHEIGF